MSLSASVHDLLACRIAAVHAVGGAKEHGVNVEGAPPVAVTR